MKPYYEEPGIAIYHGDCREIMEPWQTDSIDVVIADPPYPGLKGGTRISFDRGVGKVSKHCVTVGIPWGEDITPLADAYRICKFGMFVFCSYHFVAAVPGVVGADPCSLITWYKRNSMPSANNVPQHEAEYIWPFKKASGGLDWRKIRGMYDIPKLQAGCMATERICKNGSAIHPAQKPEALIQSLLQAGGKSVLDPYMGTGTVLAAAKKSGLSAIGIEREEKYCEIAVNRLRQSVLPLHAA